MVKKGQFPQLRTLVPLIFVSPAEYGVNGLIADLEKPTMPLIWLELAKEDEDDAVAQGNKLADVVNRTLDAKLLSYGLPFAYGITLIKSSLPLIAPVTFALSNAHYGPELAAELLGLNNMSKCRAVVHFDALPETFEKPEDASVLTADDLRLSEVEALGLAAERLDEAGVRTLYKKVDGAYDAFLAALHHQLKQPAHLVPGPKGPRALPGYEPEVPPEALLKIFMNNKRYLEALELAVYQLPHEAPEVLKEAGHAYHEQGLHKRLFKLLNNLPDRLKGEEVVLYWRLEAAFRLGHEKELKREVTDYLVTHEAPELRALYAGVYTPTQVNEALRAFQAKQTPFTAFQAGRLQDGYESIEFLKKSIELAESHGHPYEVVRAAGALAAKFIFRGHYQEAASWGKWALREFDRLGVKDGHRRLYILNNWVYARILNGDMAGLETLLKLNESQLDMAYEELAYLFRSTLGGYYLAMSQPSTTLVYYRYNLDVADRIFAGRALHNLVRALLELGEIDEAQVLCNEHLTVVQNSPSIIQARAGLALGMVLAFTNPLEAQSKLQASYHFFQKPLRAHLLSQAALYLAYSYLVMGEREKARDILQGSNIHLKNLSKAGLRLLSGPESAFRQVWALFEGQDTPLELRLLGKQEIWLTGEKLELYPQWIEIVAILAIRQRPLTLEELMSDLYGDGGNKNTLKASISRLRQVLPVSQHPYQIEGEVQADFLEVLEYLRQGRLNEAAKLYQGTLFKESNSPCIRMTGEMIIESLRRAALARDDIDALLYLSEHFPDDLELLEAAHRVLEQSDPRAPIVRARVEVVRNSWLN